MSTRRILVTGGTGALGLAVVQKLRTHSQTVFSPSRREMDITNETSVREFISSKKPDILVHLAAVTHTANTAEYDQVNRTGTQIVVDAAKSYGCERIILMSSRAAEIGGGAYAESKLRSEEIVRTSGLSYTILRPAEVYGGQAKEALALLNNWILKFHIAPLVGDGSARVAPVWIADVVETLIATTENEVAIGKTYTLAGPEEMTMRELVSRLKKFNETSAVIVSVPIGLLRIFDLIQRLFGIHMFAQDQIERLLVTKDSDITLAAKDLGFKPVTLEEGLAKLPRSI